MILRLAPFLALLFASACAPLERFEFTRVCMGVQTRVTLYAPDHDRAFAAAAGAFDRIAELDAALSDYRPTSDLSRASAAAGGPPLAVSPDLIAVMRDALAIAAASDGAFDPTVGPASHLWRRARDTHIAPTPDQLAAARALIDWRAVELDLAKNTIRLACPGMLLDLGGIAKGFAAEAAVLRLRELGCSRALVSLAGDIFAGDTPPGQPGWIVSIADGSTITITNASVSSSGDTNQSIILNGVPTAHIIEPHTATGSVTHRTVTIIAPRGSHADALATAAFLVGPHAIQPTLPHFDARAVFSDSIP